jgi:hypothetical protein
MSDVDAEPLYEYKHRPGDGYFRLWPNRIEAVEALGHKATILPLQTITSVEAKKSFFGTPKLVVRTNDGRKHEFRVRDATKAREAILQALMPTGSYDHH